jgi:hypothetical protein
MASRAGEGELEDNLPHGCVQYYVAGWCQQILVDLVRYFFSWIKCINLHCVHDVLGWICIICSDNF